MNTVTVSLTPAEAQRICRMVTDVAGRIPTATLAQQDNYNDLMALAVKFALAHLEGVKA